MQQDWAQRSELQHNQQYGAMQQAISRPSQMAAYQALGASDHQNNMQELIYNGQRRYFHRVAL